MGKFRLFVQVSILALLQLSATIAYSSGNDDNLSQYPNYVVIGAFLMQENAVRFASHANAFQLNAQFEVNPTRGLYYVYVLTTDDRQTAIAEARRLRTETKFLGTWVYNGALGFPNFSLKNYNESTGVDIHPITQKKIEKIEPTPTSAIEATTTPVTYIVDSNNQPVITKTTTEKKIEKKEVATDNSSMDVDGIEKKEFFFRLYRATDNAVVEGDVDIIDLDRTRKFASYKGNIPVKVTTPNNKTGDISLICETFGYRKVQKNINYKNPEGEDVEKDEKGQLVVPFELVRLRKGDIAVMYNVFFFKDAALMRPESHYEVNSLLEMLKENPNYKIRIHGHCNGSAAGKIITMGSDTKNFFALTGSKEGFGTSKKLSEERAKIIREFLIDNGIEDSRMQVKAWGGKRPLHDKHSNRAQENVRVEIEILSE